MSSTTTTRTAHTPWLVNSMHMQDHRSDRRHGPRRQRDRSRHTRRAFGEPGGLRIRHTRLDDPRDLAEALDGIRTVFVAMGSIGIQGVLQRIAINAAATASSIEQVTRLSVLNTSADSLGINQRARYSIDQLAFSTGVPYSTIRPAIFSASLLADARPVRASRTWTGIAGRGRMSLIDHRDVAAAGLRVLTEPALWGCASRPDRTCTTGRA